MLKSIRYSIDTIEATEGNKELIVTGWAYAESKKKVNIEIIDEPNIEIERVDRPDIYHAFKMEKSALNTGFKISIPYRDKVEVKFSTSSESSVCKFKATDTNKHQKSSSKILRIFHVFSISTIKKAFRYLKEYGLMDTIRKIKSKFIKHTHKNMKYDAWFEKNRVSLKEIDKQKRKEFKYKPVISILCFLEENSKYFDDLVQSINKQTYSNWELIVLNNTDDDISQIQVKGDYKVVNYDKKSSITTNLNRLIEEASGEYISKVEEDSVIEVDSLYRVVSLVNKENDSDFIYSDEDQISTSGKEFINPYFKEDWAPDTFRSCNYLGNFAIYKRELLLSVGGFSEGYDSSYLYDAYFKMTEKAVKIKHISKVLYHNREDNNKVVNKLEDIRAISDHLNRSKYNAKVKEGLLEGTYKVDYDIEGNPLVSILIPNKDEKDTLKGCIDSILKKSTYKNIEIIVIENNSTTEEIFEYYDEISKLDNVRVIKWKEGFNYSAINNYGFNEAKGEYIILLNNDIEVITENWIEEMLMHTQREEVGITGVKLYYPDDEIQHAGVILGIRGVAGHSHGHFKREDDGYRGRLKIVQNLSAVTAACLMIRKKVFEEVQGLDEEFPVAFNDIDFCMKVREKGYLIIFTPFVEMYHYESKSRGEDTTPEKARRFELEVKRFQSKWGLWTRDPYYNDNLTLDEEDFSLRI